MTINANSPQTAIEELTKNNAAAGKPHPQAGRGSEFQEILKKAASAASPDRQGVTDDPGAPGRSTLNANREPLAMKNREAALFFGRAEIMRSGRSAAKEEEEIRRKVQAIWLRFMMTGRISASDLQFLAQHAPELYMRALAMMREKMNPEESGNAPEQDETAAEISPDNAAAGSGVEANAGGERAAGAGAGAA
ncbi:MAG: hypothetical protein LBH95_07230 [Oscillospiraceae bacterium]|jgi:hypothetical protein|nr:hypothetical protein [Oscillospiraceae bacterium]